MASSPTKSPLVKTPTGRLGRPSSVPTDLILPTHRVKMIMKSCPDVETVPQETLHLITKATELFIQYLADESCNQAVNKEWVDYDALANAVHNLEHLEFLRETVPKKLTWAEVQKLIEENSNRFEGFF